jgi:uncharacterized membrane protein
MVVFNLMKLNNLIKIILIIAFGFTAEGCSYRKNKENSNFETTFIPTELLESISFQEVKNKVFIPKCISCHGTSGGVNLENYSSARSFLDQIEKSALVDKRMPKAGSEALSNEEFLILLAWVKAGGPETPLNGSNTPKPLPVEVLKAEFSSIKKLIIDKKCLSCHRLGGEAPRVFLNTAQDMIDSPLEIVIPGNPEESDLILTLDRENSIKPMPPMDSGISGITAQELETVKEWIKKGAKD